MTSKRIFLSDSNYFGGSKRWSVTRGDPEWPENFIHVIDQAQAEEPVELEPRPVEARVTRVAPRLERLDLEIACPATGPVCVTSVGGGAQVTTRDGGTRRIELSPRIIDLAPGTSREFSIKTPRRLGKAVRTARRIALNLRIDTLGIARPAVIRLRLL